MQEPSLATKTFLTDRVFRTEGFLIFKDCLTNSLFHLPYLPKFVTISDKKISIDAGTQVRQGSWKKMMTFGSGPQPRNCIG